MKEILSKNIFNLFKYSFIILFFGIFTFTAINYKANLYLYILYSAITLFTIFYSHKKKIKFTNLFIFFFLFFGFWAKYSLNYIFDFNLIHRIGSFDTKNLNDLDNIVKFCSLITIFFFIPNIINYNLFIKFKNAEEYISVFYYKNEQKIFIIILTTILFMTSTNYIFKFYQKGLIPHEKKLLYYFFNFYYNFLILSILSYLAFFQLRIGKIRNSLLVIIDLFLTSVTILSRWLILIYYVFFLGVLKSFKKLFLNKKFFLLSFIVIFLIILSNILVHKGRETRFNNAYIDFKNNNFSNSKSEIENTIKKKYKTRSQKYETRSQSELSLIIKDILFNRFLGVDGVMALYSSKDKSFEIFFNSFKKNEIFKFKNFYDSNYLLINSNDNIFFKTNNLISQNSPGIVAFLMYSGSIYFVLTMIFLITALTLLIEKILNDIFKNKIFVSLIIFSIIYRLFHFGYAPGNSYKYLSALFISISLPIIFNFILKIYYKKYL